MKAFLMTALLLTSSAVMADDTEYGPPVMSGGGKYSYSLKLHSCNVVDTDQGKNIECVQRYINNNTHQAEFYFIMTNLLSCKAGYGQVRAASFSGELLWNLDATKRGGSVASDTFETLCAIANSETKPAGATQSGFNQ
jgi:hypothetical protein